MRETVIKSIHGDADMLRLLCNNDVNFNKFYRFCISEVWWKKSAMKITVIWKNLHFNYHLKVLTTASRIWVDRRVVENQQVKVPSLPNPDSVNNECTKAAILTFWKIVLEIPDTVTTPFVFCWNLEFTRVKPSRVFILFCGICETLELDMHQSSF